MRCGLVLVALLVATALADPSMAAGKTSLTNKNKVGTGSGGGATNGLKNHPTGVMQFNASDCRIRGGTVIVPGDARCGKMGAAYCREPNGMAQCLDEQ